jgi:D-glycero-D-manno-heptose 1,7-bisphosphate phosphatase
MIDAVILVGGKGSRLGYLTKNIPKPLLKINNQIFLDSLIAKLIKYNFNRIYLLCSFKKESFFKLYNNKTIHNSKILCIDEGVAKGTGGALYKLKNIIKKDFLLINGDTYFDIDISKLLENKFQNNICTIALTSNNKYKKNIKINNINIDKNNLIKFSNNFSNLMNGGIYFFKKKIFKFIVKKKCSLEDDILKKLIIRKKIHGVVFKEKFIDIGSHKTIEFLKKNKGFLKQKAIFLDRDGVINKLKKDDYIKSYSEFEFLPGVMDGIKYININDYLVIIITNQSCIGKGIITEKTLNTIHNKMKRNLKLKKNAHIDDIYYSPYYKYSNNSKYRKHEFDRKPNLGMLIKAIKKWNIDTKKSLFIGDSVTDYQSSNAMKIKFYYKSNSKLISQLKKII